MLINYTVLFFQKKQQSNLLELVKNTQGFANVHEEAKNLQVEKTMKQVKLLVWLEIQWYSDHIVQQSRGPLPAFYMK